MSSILQNIARENFRTSGYISHPVSEPQSRWFFVKPPSSPFFRNGYIALGAATPCKLTNATTNKTLTPPLLPECYLPSMMF